MKNLTTLSLITATIIGLIGCGGGESKKTQKEPSSSTHSLSISDKGHAYILKNKNKLKVFVMNDKKNILEKTFTIQEKKTNTFNFKFSKNVEAVYYGDNIFDNNDIKMELSAEKSNIFLPLDAEGAIAQMAIGECPNGETPPCNFVLEPLVINQHKEIINNVHKAEKYARKEVENFRKKQTDILKDYYQWIKESTQKGLSFNELAQRTVAEWNKNPLQGSAFIDRSQEFEKSLNLEKWHNELQAKALEFKNLYKTEDITKFEVDMLAYFNPWVSKKYLNFKVSNETSIESKKEYEKRLIRENYTIETLNTSKRILFTMKSLRESFVKTFTFNDLPEGTREDIIDNVKQQFEKVLISEVELTEETPLLFSTIKPELTDAIATVCPECISHEDWEEWAKDFFKPLEYTIEANNDINESNNNQPLLLGGLDPTPPPYVWTLAYPPVHYDDTVLVSVDDYRDALVKQIDSSKVKKIEKTTKKSNINSTCDDDNFLLTINANNSPIIFGTPWSDKIIGGSSTNVVFGLSGDDCIKTKDGIDVVFGMAGKDEIDTGKDHDFAYGGSGNDVIYGGKGKNYDITADTVVLTVNVGNLLIGGAGNDDIYGYNGNDPLTVVGYGYSDVIFGDIVVNNAMGQDRVYGEGGIDFIFGQEKDDQLTNKKTGSIKVDGIPTEMGSLMFGGKGNDKLRGSNNLIPQGFGDVMFGNKDRDSIRGYKGMDFIFGDSGSDNFLNGLRGGNGTDFIFGGDGDDLIEGNNGHDLLVGMKDNDEIYGDNGSDLIVGSSGKDKLYGDADKIDLILNN